MAHLDPKLTEVDPVWHRICEEAEAAISDEPLMGGLVHAGVLHHASLERALAYRIAMKLASPEMSEQILREIADEMLPREDLREQAIEALQRQIEVDEPEEDKMAFLMGAEAPDHPAAEELTEEQLLRALLAEQGN